jgi:hypothetical protein
MRLRRQGERIMEWQLVHLQGVGKRGRVGNGC